MEKRTVQKLDHGLYIIFWKSGGHSLAAVGSLRNGNRWLAPTNWVSVENSGPKVWKSVLKAIKI